MNGVTPSSTPPSLLCEKYAHHWPLLREVGATVRQNVFVRDVNVEVGVDDARQIEVLAQDLLCYGGVQMAVDITLRSVLTCQGEAHAHAADDGAMLTKARADKEARYPELATSGRCKLIVMAMETGGRWSEESVAVLRELSHVKAQEAPFFMRFSVIDKRQTIAAESEGRAASPHGGPQCEPAEPSTLLPTGAVRLSDEHPWLLCKRTVLMKLLWFLCCVCVALSLHHFTFQRLPLCFLFVFACSFVCGPLCLIFYCCLCFCCCVCFFVLMCLPLLLSPWFLLLLLLLLLCQRVCFVMPCVCLCALRCLCFCMFLEFAVETCFFALAFTLFCLCHIALVLVAFR